MKFGNMVFRGKSGESYRFQAWPLETRFKPMGAVYFVTKRETANTSYDRAYHDNIYVGETASLADPFGTRGQLDCFKKHGANCVCIYPMESEEKRVAIQQDLLAIHSTHCNA